jgi:type I protein arginine methyltransferase
VCLLCSETFPSATETLAHAAAAHKCDVFAMRDALHLDLYGCIKLINYIRTWHAAHPEEAFVAPTASDLESEGLLRPVLPDDPLLQVAYTEDDEDDDGHIGGAGQGAALEPSLLIALGGSEMGDGRVAVSGERLAALVEQLRAAERDRARLHEAFQSYREAVEESMLGGAAAAELRREEKKDGAKSAGAAAAAAPAGDKPKREGDQSGSESDSEHEADTEGYFKSYAHHGIHAEMLQDVVRTESYRDALLHNPALLKDKVVLDVGCGTGILSMFAARAGARKVYAVDNSSIAELAREIVAVNGLSDKVTVLRGRMEELMLPERVDLIVSEWMGYGLLFEAMLDSVIHARDRWLNPDGHVFPDKAGMYLVGLSDTATRAHHVTFWQEVYGFDMTPMIAPVLREASVEIVPPSAIATLPATLRSLDLRRCAVSDLVFTAPFTLRVAAACEITAICLYFDIFFEEGCDAPVRALLCVCVCGVVCACSRTWQFLSLSLSLSL